MHQISAEPFDALFASPISKIRSMRFWRSTATATTLSSGFDRLPIPLSLAQAYRRDSTLADGVARCLNDAKSPAYIGGAFGYGRCWLLGAGAVSYTHLTLPTIYSV